MCTTCPPMAWVNIRSRISSGRLSSGDSVRLREMLFVCEWVGLMLVMEGEGGTRKRTWH